MMNRLITLCFILTISGIVHSQASFDFGFARSQSIPVSDNGIDTLTMAWAGGLNSVHFNQIDLNYDGIQDLVAFDKHGDKILPFLNDGTQGTSCYSYAPEYEKAFPSVYSWMILRDYDCDGLKDIFCYGFGGISVYRNVGSAATGLSFQLKTSLLNSLQDNVLINILVTDMDFPAIDDIDGDGDLDILCFFGLGSFVQYHKNFSVENHGNCNYLDYKLMDKCWGRIAEHENSNALTLNVSCPWKQDSEGNKQVKHTGSTMQILDLNNDSVSDLLLGDTDYLNIKSLINGGTKDSAHIISQDSSFPANTTPVNISSIPAASWFDFDNDSIKELVFAPFESRTNIPSNYDNIWYYENSGSGSPVFSLASTRFLQDQMMDLGAGSHPIFVDYNGDSLLDIIVGNYGYIDSTWYYFGNLEASFIATLALYKNVGTAQYPSFQLVDRDFGNLSQYEYTAIRPTFGDLDGDGDLDLIIGERGGILHMFQNTAGLGNPMSLSLLQSNFQNINVGLFAAPQLIDLDRDGLIDLVIGSRNTTWNASTVPIRKASVHFYKNTGSLTNPAFTLVTDSLGGVDATDSYLNPYYGYAVPWFFDDSLGNRHLFLGSVNGSIYHYTNIDGNLNGVFTRSDTVFMMLNDSVPQKVFVGGHASPTVAYLDDDGKPDFMVGNFSGGLNYFQGIKAPPIDVGIATSSIPNLGLWLYPNPAHNMVTVELPRVNLQGMVEIEFFDISGRRVKHQNSAPELIMHIEVSDLSPGVYFVKATLKEGNNNRIGVSKLIVR